MTRYEALVIGENSFPFHAFDEMGQHIVTALGSDVDATLTTERETLTDLSSYDCVVDYLTDSTLTDGERDGLFSFVRNGGGYLGLHCAADLTSMSDGSGGIEPREEPFPAFRELLGGHFIGHPEQSTFGVEIVDDEHPITDGVGNFDVYDEPYRLTYDERELHVLARMDHPELESYPVIWAREYGSGRVCYVSLGHTVESLENDTVQQLLRRAVRWISAE